MCDVNRLCHTNILSIQYIEIQSIVDLKNLPIIFEVFNNMSVPANV